MHTGCTLARANFKRAASDIAQHRIAAMAQELAMLKARSYADDDLADRQLLRSLIDDVRAGLDAIEVKLLLPRLPI